MNWFENTEDNRAGIMALTRGSFVLHSSLQNTKILGRFSEM